MECVYGNNICDGHIYGGSPELVAYIFLFLLKRVNFFAIVFIVHFIHVSFNISEYTSCLYI